MRHERSQMEQEEWRAWSLREITTQISERDSVILRLSNTIKEVSYTQLDAF